MNPFLKPSVTIPFLINRIIDPGRIQRLNSKQLESYQSKAFKKILNYAYKIPLYNKKYKELGINPSEIKSIKDITKLPFISRNDIKQYFPNGIIPTNFNKKKGNIICTGGTSNKYCCNSGAEPVCTYTDFKTLLRSINISYREQDYFNLNWKKTKFAHIGNFNSFKFDDIFEKNIFLHAKSLMKLDNYLNIQATNKTMELIEKLESFRPDVIISYPAIFQEIAFLKNKGYGKNIRPRLLFVGGAMLDQYTRRYVEHSLECPMYNTYASCESGGGIAFECTERNWHIHSDFFYLEAVDENLELVNPGERGRLVITKLWGGGTPIIRYTGMQDWITLGKDKICKCGLKAPIFEKPVEGRIISNIILSDGRIIPPSSILFITEVLLDLNTFKVKKFQIIQDKIDVIKIFLMIDDDQRTSDPSYDIISDEIIKKYKKELGETVEILVEEVQEIKDVGTSGKPYPLVVSHVNSRNNCSVT